MSSTSTPSPFTLTRLFGPWVTRVNTLTLRADLLAGLLGAILVLPQAIAFATLAGLPPQYGFYTAIVPCMVAAVFGSSWHVMSGPTNANSLALFAMLSPLAAVGSPAYIELVFAVTIMVGVMQWAIGVLRLGSMANFISPSALLGFTGGAAMLIVIHGMADLLGLQAPASHGTSGALQNLAQHAVDTQWPALVVGLVAIAVSLGVRRIDKRWPAMVIGMIVATALAQGLNLAGYPVTVIGPLPSVVPHFHLPQIEWSRVTDLVGLAFSLTIVALGQSVSIAKAVAGRSGQHIDTNREFVGQGVSNVVGGLFQCYVSCGSLNRSMPNLEAGAQTPMAAVFSAGLLLALVAVSAPLLALIPFAGISGLLLLVAWSLLDIPRWRRTWHLSRPDFFVAAATFVATITIRLEVAILIGTVMSLMTYLQRTSRPAMRTMGFDGMDPERRFVVVEDTPGALPECPQLKLLRMEGSIYFGATAHVSDRLHAIRADSGQAQKHLLVMSKSMNFIDASGADLWKAEMSERRAMGGDLYFHRPRPQVLEMWRKTGFFDQLGRDHLFPDKRTALAAIYQRLDPEICAKCTARIFWECGPPGQAPGRGGGAVAPG